MTGSSFSLLFDARRRWAITPRLIRRGKMLQCKIIRCGWLFILYVFAVFMILNMMLFHHYGPLVHQMQDGKSSSRFALNASRELENCTAHSTNDCFDEDEDHYPGRHVDNILRDSHGKPYTFQSLPQNDEERKYYTLKKYKVHPFNYKYLIESRNVCNQNTTIIALINSQPSNVARRAGIRETWGSLATNGHWPHNRTIKGELKIAFVFGIQDGWSQKLLDESKKYNDIVQGNFTDAYRNLTLKSLMGMKWIIENCAGVSYYLKSDDDMIINFPYLLDILTSKPSLKRTIMGPLAVASRVYRRGKWALDKSIYPFNRYPPYEPGAAYLMTADLVGEIFQAAEFFPQIFIDDVYLTGILGRALGVSHARQGGFSFWGTRPPDACSMLLDKVITGHKLIGAKLVQVWKDMQTKTVEECKKPKPRLPAKKTDTPKTNNKVAEVKKEVKKEVKTEVKKEVKKEVIKEVKKNETSKIASKIKKEFTAVL